MVLALNNFSCDFCLTFAEEFSIAKIGQIFELLSLFSCLTIILTKQSISIFVMEYGFNHEFIFSHKLAPIKQTMHKGH